ncbi:TIGR03899 family protein [Photobacterium frigidiphilum]|uniref:TIGR03899 family protein n=1 Tax=Photobacterium frigidiphilum TaxID=264736 RepID=UPI003D0E14BA
MKAGKQTELITLETKTSVVNEKKHQLKSAQNKAEEIAQKHAISAQIKQTEHDIQQRTSNRILLEQKNEQRNLERVVKVTYETCRDETAGDPDPDWLARFFSMAKKIHSPSMQILWGKILKREILFPGSVSLKSLKTLQNMTQREAQIFQQATSLTCNFGNDKSQKLLTGIKEHKGKLSLLKKVKNHRIQYGAYQLSYSNLLILIDLSLLLKTELESGEIAKHIDLPFGYKSNDYSLQPIRKGITFTYYRLSPTGEELANLFGSSINQQYKDMLSNLLSQHFIVQSNKE